jgi:ATP-dependent Clp protease adaptor protein ClpS
MRTKTMSDTYDDDAGTAVLDRDEIDIEEPGQYIVIFINDNYTTCEFVVLVLRQVFHKTGEEAEQIMTDVHTKGKGVAYTGAWDICATKAQHAMILAKQFGFPLRVEVEPA